MRIPLDSVVDTLKEMSNGKLTWKEVMMNYPKFEQQETKCIQ